MQLANEQILELQRTEKEIFEAFIEVCEKLNIKYYLLAGTLLGAVRHQGFIPWDDDIDVGIMREDYELFLKEAGKLLPEHLFLQTYKTDEEYPRVFAKIRNSNSTFIETAVKDNKMNHGLYIDVFPLDRCDPQKRYSFGFRTKEKIYSMRSSSLMKNYKLDLRRRLIRVLCMLVCPSANKALRKMEALYTSMPDGGCVVNFSGIYGEREVMPLDWYGEGAMLSFEGLTVTAPKEYEKWLTQVYGDYMSLPPVEKRVTHHFTEKIDVNTPYEVYCNTSIWRKG